MSLCEQVKLETEHLSDAKMSALRDLLRTRQTIAVITPKRPDRKGLSSEVVLERKLAEKKKILHKVAETRAVVNKPEPVRAKPVLTPGNFFLKQKQGHSYAWPNAYFCISTLFQQ